MKNAAIVSLSSCCSARAPSATPMCARRATTSFVIESQCHRRHASPASDVSGDSRASRRVVGSGTHLVGFGQESEASNPGPAAASARSSPMAAPSSMAASSSRSPGKCCGSRGRWGRSRTWRSPGVLTLHADPGRIRHPDHHDLPRGGRPHDGYAEAGAGGRPGHGQPARPAPGLRKRAPGWDSECAASAEDTGYSDIGCSFAAGPYIDEWAPAGRSGVRQPAKSTAKYAPMPLTLRGVETRIRGSFFLGGVPKRPTGADCKSAGLRLRRFESFPLHHSFRVRRNDADRG